MTTVDYRDSNPYSAAGLSLPSIVEEDMGMINLDQAISERQFEIPRLRRLSALVIDLAFAVRRTLAVIRAKTVKRNVTDNPENQEE